MLGDVGNPATLDADLTMRGPDAAVWGEVLGMAEAFEGDASLSASIEPVGSGVGVRVSGNVAAFDVSLDGTIADIAAADDIDLRFAVDGPDIGVFGLLTPLEGFPRGPFRGSGRWRSAGAKLALSDVELETEAALLTLTADFDQFPSFSSGAP